MRLGSEAGEDVEQLFALVRGQGGFAHVAGVETFHRRAIGQDDLVGVK